ncbi:MAG: hypothetical protein EHM48_01630 [Planctomycetaceae bacterium]|nr:MAG: hypothetical protein EHM48_01630 [Planctomycetaceae bacterium]
MNNSASHWSLERSGKLTIWALLVLSALLGFTASTVSAAPPTASKPVATPAQADAKPTPTSTGPMLLDTSGYWRVFYTLQPPVVRDGDKLTALAAPCRTEGPAKDWTSPDFADGQWVSLQGAPFPSIRIIWSKISQMQIGFASINQCSPDLAQLSVRGKFEVADPDKVKGLSLELAYRGGVVVYVNGKEVARKDIVQGKDASDLIGADYADEAFFKADGNLLIGDAGEKDPETMRRWSLHIRQAENIAIPSSALRKGVNVLAIEVHRSPYPQAVAAKIKAVKGDATSSELILCGLLRCRLTAGSAEGVISNFVRPTGMVASNSDVLVDDYDADYRPVGQTLNPIRIVGARAGTFSGKVVVSSDKPIVGLKAVASDLVSADGKTIPAAAITVRYAQLDTDMDGDGGQARYPVAVKSFDALATSAPTNVPVPERKPGRGNWSNPGQPKYPNGSSQPIWATIAVPADAAEGKYKGKLTITANGEKPIEAELDVTVCGFKLPPPSQFDTLVDFIQSPESVAMQYKVPLWSDEHFKLLARSFELLGQLGNRSVYLHLICQTNQGNEESMVRWIKQPDGSYKHDFTVLEKYLDTAIKNMGQPRMVCLYLFDMRHGGAASDKDGAIMVSEVGVDGKVTPLMLPKYGTPESDKLWKPVAEGVMQILKKRNLDKAAVLGVIQDGAPDKSVTEGIKKLYPNLSWMRHAHTLRKDVNGMPLAYQCLVWTPKFLTGDEPAGKHSYGWKDSGGVYQFCRSQDVYPTLISRLVGEMNIAGSQSGFGRIGLDFWPVLADKKGKRVGTIQARYPQTSWENLDWMTRSFVPPGPDGAMGTPRFEMMREGLQECQARIYIEKALLDPALRAKLGDELATKCQSVLDERTKAMLLGLDNHLVCGFGKTSLSNHGWWSSPGQVGKFWYITSGWQDRSEKLYAAAAAVAAKLGQ